MSKVEAKEEDRLSGFQLGLLEGVVLSVTRWGSKRRSECRVEEEVNGTVNRESSSEIKFLGKVGRNEEMEDLA